MLINKITLPRLLKTSEISKGMMVLTKSALGVDHQQYCCSEISSKHVGWPKLCGKNIKFFPVKSDGV
jgi:hypothetical protein